MKINNQCQAISNETQAIQKGSTEDQFNITKRKRLQETDQTVDELEAFCLKFRQTKSNEVNLQEEVRTLKAENKRLRADIESLRADNVSLRADNKSLREANEILLAANKSLREANETLHDRLNIQENELNRIKVMVKEGCQIF